VRIELTQVACDLLTRHCMTTLLHQAIPLDGSGPRAGAAALTGTSATIRGFKHALPSLARADVPLIITGEPGTGKSEWAQAIHRHSERAAGPFHVVPLATLPEQRIERRLFGEPGKEGLLAKSRGATVYLAGTDTLSPRLQQRLAQWLAVENGGAVRVIAGSCAPLDAQVRLGRFSRVLYQRLALIQLTIPPLRERVEDIAAIVEDQLWHASGASSEPALVIRDSALGELAAHSWPENVRELVRVLADARPSARGSSITAELVRKVLRGTARPRSSPEVLPLDRVELDYIVVALALCDGNQTLAARRLGIGRSTLLRKLKTHAPGHPSAALRGIA
jgi:DNA-binding NtrC family response regulator